MGNALRVAGAVGIGGAVAALTVDKGRSGKLVWQLDPAKCIACGNCATLLRAGRVGREVRPQLHDVRLLRPVHRLFPAGADRARTRRRRTSSAPPGPSSARSSKTRTSSTRSTSGCASAAASASRAATPSATARSTCRCGTTAARTATSARSPSPAPRRPSAACRPTSPIC